MSTASAMENEIERLARWSLRLFGGFELSVLPRSERVALPRKRERVLVAYLALSPNCRTSRRKLATLLWGDATDETALEKLRTEIWSVRKALGDAEHRVIASEGEDIVLDAKAFEVDVLTFRRLAAQSDRAELEAAAKLYSGELLDGLGIENEEFESWRRTQATRCRDQAIEVLNRLMTQLAELGETERAIEAGLRLLEFDPLHEAAGRRLMRLYGGSGRRSAAVQLYRSLSDALKTDLDAQPEAETRALYAEIARGGKETPAPAAADAKPASQLASMARPPDDSPSEAPPAQPFVPSKFGPGTGAPRPARSRTLGWILVGGLAAAMAIFLIYEFAPPTGPTTAQQTGVEAAKATSSTQAAAISIAVLPFVNLSGDAAQEFFSDGITEEITSALSKIPDLRVVARTSAYQFKGERKDLRVIARALNATHLIEGSVRKEGDRVRITAQLIEADGGVHVWAENYDRQLTGVFAIQEEIATAIAGALRRPLGLIAGESLVSNRSIDPESYQQFLRARTILRSRGGQAQADVANRYAGAIGMLEQVVARHPSYAPAWALLAMMTRDPDRAETAAREAIRLDSRNAFAYEVLALHQNFRSNFAGGEDLARHALALDPNEPEVLSQFSNSLVTRGRIREALSLRERLRTLEPFIPTYNIQTANYMLIEGQNEAAIAILQALPAGAARNISLAHAYAAEGRYGEAADTLLATPLADRTQSRQSIEDAARLLRSAPTKVKAPEALPVFTDQLSYVYAYIGALDRGLEDPERLIAQGNGLALVQSRHLWSPEYAPIRKTERFKALMRAAKFVDYWRARGWPDRCRPVGADDFVCV